ncbi:MAG: alpha/beta fold hydrolase [Ilumatobacteraceae bacterium]
MSDIEERTVHVNGVDLQVTSAGDPTGPCVILSHGFPESSYSWRHQIPVLAAAGYHVLAPDQRGYAFSSAPRDVAAYGIGNLTGDLVALLDAYGHDDAIFVGHDWGAMVVWEAARLHPTRVRAVVGVSVPFTAWPARPTDIMKAMWTDRFFYILYFQQVGPAERELEADVRRTMHTILWGASGEMYKGMPTEFPPMEGTGFLDMFKDVPAALPRWLTQADLDHYVRQFENSGFFGPVSWYRNLDANYEVLKELPASLVTMPAYFIGGEKDGVIAGRPEYVDGMNGLLPNYRGKTMIPGAGHWTQQEAPEEFNAALLGFLATL